MDTITGVLMFMVLLASLWDIRRGQRITEGIVRDMQGSVERIAQLTAEALRRPPEGG
jgi:hypothetical protein